MTDITELAQRNELLIANGQQTADLLRHLADNEIDSDYFAVVSECESYGKETDAELSITEFALRAAGYVDALVEALEKAQAKADVYDMLRDDYGLREKGVGLVDFVDWQAKRIADLESRTVKMPEPFKLAKSSSGLTYYFADDVDAALTDAGIKVEAE
ncbi:hypothetical protein V7R93_05650 [Klebsiella pneumoniae]|uniref:hypothetical protein n=1 Tax=Klebsiella pneumoniae TaxID=573 RepID=UPI00272FF698|nr:hypothetical protein [Klebsiella pneumoniae]MDP0949957.1 hypothetical protein [Klebsiella pneumoniae]